mmetsp:Transcript_89044/g.247795  ORF Transcript_89044/g.247795 Transcript_89044/m.247795 type:complete len:117 (-) Transcript_89044:177-527(-)
MWLSHLRDTSWFTKACCVLDNGPCAASSILPLPASLRGALTGQDLTCRSAKKRSTDGDLSTGSSKNVLRMRTLSARDERLSWIVDVGGRGARHSAAGAEAAATMGGAKLPSKFSSS